MAICRDHASSLSLFSSSDDDDEDYEERGGEADIFLGGMVLYGLYVCDTPEGKGGVG